MKNSERRPVGRLFLIALLLLIIYFTIKSFFQPIKKPQKSPQYKKSEHEPETEMVQDPVCGVYVPLESAFTLSYQGKVYYFCSSACREKFQEKLKSGEEK